MRGNLKSLVLLICNAMHFFFDYKSSDTVKALPCLTPHGSAVKIPKVYFGSITDTILTEIVGALDNVLCHYGVLTDKGKYFYYIYIFLGMVDYMLCLENAISLSVSFLAHSHDFHFMTIL